MTDKEIFFQQLSQEEHRVLRGVGESITFSPNDIIIKRGVMPESLYVVNSGKVNIVKIDENSQRQHKIVQLKKGAILGVLEFVDGSPSSTCAIAVTPVSVTRYPVAKLRQFAEGVHNTLYTKLAANLARVLVQRIRHINDVVASSLQQELATAKINHHHSIHRGRWFLMMLYVLGLPYVASLSKQMVSTTYTTSGVLVVFTTFFVYYIYNNQLPWKLFGIKRDNLMLQFWQGVYYSLPCLFIIFLLKLFIITQIPEFHSEPLFSPFGSLNSSVQATATWRTLVPIISMYMFFSIAQEFSTRCVLQGSYQYFLSGTRYSNLKAIIMANLVFSACHVHISPTMVVMVSIPGFFWGWLFYRTRSLISISVSHILIGCWSLFGLGLGFLFLE